MTSTQQPVETRVPAETLARSGKQPLRRGRLITTLLQLGVFVAFLAAWQLVVRWGLIDPFFVSRPTDVYHFLIEFLKTGEAWVATLATLRATLLGFLLGSAAGMLAGFVFSTLPYLGDIFRPFLTALNALPRVALAPMFILWFGIGIESKVYLAVSLVFFIVLLNTEAAIKNTDRELITMSLINGASARQQFFKIALPASVPALFAALRLSLVYSLLGVVVGEMLAAERGLGLQLTLYSGTFRAAGVFGVLAILVVIALILNGVMVALERRMSRWNSGSRARN